MHYIRHVALGVLMAAYVAGADESRPVSFGNESDWTVDNFEKKLKLSFDRERGAFCIVGAEKTCDTAWRIRSRKFLLPPGARGFRLSFKVSCTLDIGGTPPGVGYGNEIRWFDGDGNSLGVGSLAFLIGAGERQGIYANGPIPGGARQAEVQFGFNKPNVIGSDGVCYSDLLFETFDWPVKSDGSRMANVDSRAPRAFVISATPTENASERLQIRVEDSSGVDWTSLRLWVDGVDVTADALRTNDVLTVGCVFGDTWSNGLHRVRCAVSDLKGNSYTNRLVFFIGSTPKTPKVSVRDDGVTLIGGEPFFPIGIFGVTKREFNGMDIDIAFRDLKKAGFNFAHTYDDSYDPEFLAAAKRHGFRLWVQARTPGRKLIEIGRHNPSIIAWYLGDDTSVHEIPEELKNYDDMVKAVDPMRITCQADIVNHDVLPLPYERYRDGTDVIMPEIYHISGEKGHPSDRTCVAKTIDNMKSYSEAIRKYALAPRACWPILQYFQGWTWWRHFPSRQQLFATSFAAVIHGAKGIVWYTYGGFYNKKRDYFDEGITSRPERFRDMSDLCTWLKELAPALVARDCPQPSVDVIGKVMFDPSGNPAVSGLLKRQGDVAYLITVNSAPEKTRARFSLGKFTGSVEVMREKRSLKCEMGVLEDDYEPFAVHVYKFVARRQ